MHIFLKLVYWAYPMCITEDTNYFNVDKVQKTKNQGFGDGTNKFIPHRCFFVHIVLIRHELWYTISSNCTENYGVF